VSGKYNEIASDSLINKCVVTQSNQVKVKPLTTIQAVLDDINDGSQSTYVSHFGNGNALGWITYNYYDVYKITGNAGTAYVFIDYSTLKPVGIFI
jgi:hypothetical protein